MAPTRRQSSSSSLSSKFSDAQIAAEKGEALEVEIEDDADLAGKDAGPAGLAPVPSATQEEDMGADDAMDDDRELDRLEET